MINLLSTHDKISQKNHVMIDMILDKLLPEKNEDVSIHRKKFFEFRKAKLLLFFVEKLR